jgi:mannose-6-phosphate isomerase-like protein (cupin superfamily)
LGKLDRVDILRTVVLHGTTDRASHLIPFICDSTIVVTQPKSKSIEEIRDGDQLLAVIIYAEFQEAGIHFFTPNELSQQLAYMQHPAGKVIEPHVHNPVPREVHYTQEVLFIKSGRLKVDFYTNDRYFLGSRELGALDVVLLVQGGHGFEMLEPVEMIEVKQGPYVGELDKTRFSPWPRC